MNVITHTFIGLKCLTETKIQILCDHVSHTRLHTVEMGCQMVQLLSAYIVGPIMCVNLTPAIDSQMMLRIIRESKMVPIEPVIADLNLISVHSSTFTVYIYFHKLCFILQPYWSIIIPDTVFKFLYVGTGIFPTTDCIFVTLMRNSLPIQIVVFQDTETLVISCCSLYVSEFCYSHHSH